MDIQVQLKHVRITDLNYNAGIFDHTKSIPLITNMGLKFGLTDPLSNRFTITFNIKLEDEGKTFFLSLLAVAEFETNIDLNQEFKDSPFAKINAPAIAFPYIRTFISNFTLNSGISPIILPSFNFVKIAEEKTQ